MGGAGRRCPLQATWNLIPIWVSQSTARTPQVCPATDTSLESREHADQTSTWEAPAAPRPTHPSECGQRNGCPKANPSAQSRPPRVCPEAHLPTPAPVSETQTKGRGSAENREANPPPPKVEGRADAFALKTLLRIQQENLSRDQPSLMVPEAASPGRRRRAGTSAGPAHLPQSRWKTPDGSALLREDARASCPRTPDSSETPSV